MAGVSSRTRPTPIRPAAAKRCQRLEWGIRGNPGGERTATRSSTGSRIRSTCRPGPGTSCCVPGPGRSAPELGGAEPEEVTRRLPTAEPARRWRRCACRRPPRAAGHGRPSPSLGTEGDGWNGPERKTSRRTVSSCSLRPAASGREQPARSGRPCHRPDRSGDVSRSRPNGDVCSSGPLARLPAAPVAAQLGPAKRLCCVPVGWLRRCPGRAGQACRRG